MLIISIIFIITAIVLYLIADKIFLDDDNIGRSHGISIVATILLIFGILCMTLI